jgi:hypothetical protein
MADNPELEVVGIRSNINSLSEKAFHDVLVNLVRNELLVGEVALKTLVPKREGDMAAHAGHKGPIDTGLEIEGSVGIPEIHKAGESDPFSAKYPLFVDEGTGIFGEHGTIFPKEKRFMYIPPDRGIPGFLRTSKGQEGRHFMAKTFSIMQAMLQINGELFRSELNTKLKAGQLTDI